MTGDEAIALNAALQRIWRMCNRRAPGEAEVQFWLHELRAFPGRDVLDALRHWERASDDEHPPTLKQILRVVNAKAAARLAGQQQRVGAQKWGDSTPHSRAFARLWRATGGDPAEFDGWCRRTLADRSSSAEDRAFADAVLPMLAPARPGRKAVAVDGFTRIGAAIETDAAREARLEREAIQSEGVMT